MARVQLILSGVPRTTTHDIYDYPIVLQFGDRTSFEEAMWVIPSFPRRIPAPRLSEIRVEPGQGPLTVLIDGPEGFRSGPHPADWVRAYYPRGKHCSLLKIDAATKSMGGISLSTFEGTLIVDSIHLGGPSPAPAAETPESP